MPATPDSHRPTTSAELRSAYLSFFEEKGCQIWPSSSLVPDDPSLLLTVAGMVQFKPYFLQQKHLDSRYVGTVTAQKCVRTNDIDLIGTDGRHLSFFEMLGNFSFGEYFKDEMCAWAWEFSTEVMGLDPERIHVTVYTDDDEAAEIWERVGVAKDHITRLGEEDNFWVAGPTGPCGPCSEMYYDQGPGVGCGRDDCKPGCDCDRYLEYWNLVFTQFDRQEDGTMVPLAKKNIDTGMGLERAAAIQQGVTSNFDTDVLRGLIAVGERLSNASYGKDEKTDLSLRIMADHSRAIAFMAADGVLPSNEGRGYVLRRLLRRAVRHGRLLGIEGPFLGEFLEVVVESMGEAYPELSENRSLIERVLASEEERFGRTIEHGMRYLEDALDGLSEGAVLDGERAFTLHDTYGFPIELTAEIASERGVTVDSEGFEREMTAQRERARAARTGEAWEGITDIYDHILDEHGPSEFVGYRADSCGATVVAIVCDGQLVEEVTASEVTASTVDSGAADSGAAADSEPADSTAAADSAAPEISVILDSTPFYAEMGGQVGDTGTIVSAADGDASGDAGPNTPVLFTVTDTTRPADGLHAHTGVLETGTLRVGMHVTASIDTARRARIAKNHTATHILQKALSEVLGDHVKQAGSLVAPDRLRFDFTHFEPMHHPEIARVERIVNEVVMADMQVLAYETSLSAARESGVTALFGEKYGEFVRVIEVGGFSKELCGGTHVAKSSEIGMFKIVSESSVGANTRRIEAVTSIDAYEYMSRREEELWETAHFLEVPPLDVSERVEKMARQIADFESAAKRARQAAVEGDIRDLMADAVDAGGYRLLVCELPELGTVDALRSAWDITKGRAKGEPIAVVIFTVNEEKGTPLMLAAGNDGAVAAGFDAGAVVREVAPVLGGGGGGKPQMAQAGGKDASAIGKAVERTRELLVG